MLLKLNDTHNHTLYIPFFCAPFLQTFKQSYDGSFTETYGKTHIHLLNKLIFSTGVNWIDTRSSTNLYVLRQLC
jgi:hypothetical protein